jgi:hypothetical protein
MRLFFALCLASALGAGSPAWDIQAKVSADGRSFQVEGRFAPGDADGFMVGESAAPFVDRVEAEAQGRWRPVPEAAGRWRVKDGEARGAHLRWSFDLARSGVRPFGGGYLMRTGAWLLRPETFQPGRSARLSVAVPEGLAFISGLGPGTDFETTVDDLDSGPECALGAMSVRRFPAKGGVIAAVAPAGALPMTEAQETRWFGLAASALENAYGRLPLPWTAVYLYPTGRRTGVIFGSTRGGGGAAIVVLLGQTVSDQDIADDWILTHELIHTALPDLDREHHWLEEGLPTYLEPLIRLRQNREGPETFWAALRADLPQGLPRPGDRGLDRTRTWGRTYWGGALFCFTADLRIREASQGRATLLTALRAMLAGGGIARHGDLRALLAEGDAALPRPVLLPLYEAWSTAPEAPDLEAVWKRLGATPLDGRAPEAGLRQAWGR